MNVVDALAAVVVLAGVGYLWVGARARAHRDRPAGVPFVAMALAAGLSGVALGAVGVLDAGGLGVSLVGPALFLPIAWGVFAMTYTGWRRLVTPLGVGAVSAPAVVVVVLLPALRTGTGPGTAGWPALLAVLAYTGALLLSLGTGIVGVGLLFRTVYSNRLVGPGLGATVTVAGVAPWVSALSALAAPGGLGTGPAVGLGLGPSGSAGLLAAGFGVGAAAAGLAVGRYDAFGATPAAGNLGRRTAIAELDDPVVVVDDRGQVVDHNGAARDAFGVEGPPAGAPVGRVLGADLEALRAPGTVTLHAAAGRRRFESTVSTVADEHDRTVGHVVLLRDVTAELTRRQRLEVLNRVLRHNIRNDMTVVEGYAGIAADRVEDDDARAALDRVLDAADAVRSIGERAREVERLLDAPRTVDADRSLGEVLDRAVGAVREEYPDARIRVEAGVDPTLRLRPSTVEHVVGQLVENAVEHNDTPTPTVRVGARAVDDDRYPLAVAVADDGPGIPDGEWAAVADGDETDLEHASGLGLWAVNWAVARLGGRVELSENDPRGTVVTVRLPESVGDATGDGPTDAGTDPAPVPGDGPADRTVGAGDDAGSEAVAGTGDDDGAAPGAAAGSGADAGSRSAPESAPDWNWDWDPNAGSDRDSPTTADPTHADGAGDRDDDGDRAGDDPGSDGLSARTTDR